MLKQSVIEESNAPYASNILVVMKTDGKPRICIDYRQLNTQTVRDQYPLPNIQAMYREVGHATYFTTIDLESGFWQLEVRPSDRHKTAFTTRSGLYQFKRMPFGLCNAPATFQRMMDIVIDRSIQPHCRAYIDDVVTFSDDIDKHVHHLDLLLQRLIACGLTIKMKKCKFARTEVKFLGCIISHNTLKPDCERATAVTKWEKLTSVKTVRMFLGLCNYYRNFITHFSDTAEPLYRLLRKEASFEWTIECAAAFAKLKLALTSAPALILPDPIKPYTLRTDASQTSLSLSDTATAR